MSLVAPPFPPDQNYISQFATDTVGIQINVGGVLTDPDNSTVTIQLVNESGVTVFSRSATRLSQGQYTYQFTSSDTSVPGNYSFNWLYSMGSIAQTYTVYVKIGYASPAYDSLSPDFKAIVESVNERFGDLFDSPHGGPHLQVYFQTHMDRGRIAGLLKMAIGQINIRAQPFMTFSTDTTQNTFPFVKWGALLEQEVYIQTIKHLIRSYTEQPIVEGTGIARDERRDYFERWQAVLSMELPTLQEMYEHFKIANMGLSRPRVLVSGGVFGNYGPTRVAGSMAARPRWYTRWY